MPQNVDFSTNAPPMNMPWWMWDKTNKELITSKLVPGDISDTKKITLSETQTPGLNYDPISTGGAGNRKLAFQIPVVMRNNTVGNSLLLAQFDRLRENASGTIVASGFKQSESQFAPRPKVIYSYGIGQPLEFFVNACNFTHKTGFINELGYSKFTAVSIELWLDEESPLFIMAQSYRKLASFAGQIQNSLTDTGATRAVLNRRPY